MSLVDYLAFAGRNRRFLVFGFLLTFTSSAGQTFFIGLFGPELRTTFALDHTDWGGLYLVGTLASAIVLPWTGQLIDRLDLRTYVVLALLGLAVACVVMSLAQSTAMLALAIFLLRQTGQGLTSHAAATSMARYHGSDRGKALAIASIGTAIGMAALPILAILAIAALGWRLSFAVTGLIIALASLPAALWLLRDHGERHERHLALAQAATGAGPATGDRTRSQMLRDRRFHLLLPAFLAPSFIITALFFHHLTLAEGKGWSPTWVTGQYWVYALSAVAASLAAGPLVDRLTARRIMPLFLLPLTMALGLLWPAQAPGWLLPYLALLGLTSGLAFTGFTALWAELYGTGHLGAIRSLAGALSVFASALGPVSAGLLLDRGVRMEVICLGFAAFCLAATLLLVLALRAPRTMPCRTCPTPQAPRE